MEITEFIKNFAAQLEDTPQEDITSETIYIDLDEWSSLTSLAIQNMIKKKYGVKVLRDEMKNAKKISTLFELIESKLK